MHSHSLLAELAVGQVFPLLVQYVIPEVLPSSPMASSGSVWSCLALSLLHMEEASGSFNGSHCQNLAMQTQCTTSRGCAFSLRAGSQEVQWVNLTMHPTINILALIWTTGTKKIALILLGIINIKLVLHDGE